MHENIHVLNVRVNIFSWEQNILTRKFVKLEIITSRYISYYTSSSCATAKYSQIPALDAACSSMLQLEISTYDKMVSNLMPYVSFQCRAHEWESVVYVDITYDITFINQSGMPIGENLTCRWEPTNESGRYAVAVTKDGSVIGH